MKLAWLAAALAVFALGCGDDDSFFFPPNTTTPTVTPTATPTSPPTATAPPTTTATPTRTSPATPTATTALGPGPAITFFGMTRADDTLLTPNGMSGDGTPVYQRLPGASGLASGFVLIIEGKPGSSGAPLGRSSYDVTGMSFPDLFIQVNQPLGNGSTEVCDDPQERPGGVPATVPVSFEDTPENIAAVNDLACRFLDGRGGSEARTNRADSCVNFNGTFDFVGPGTTTQFCGFMNVPLGFPPGDTTITARLRDIRGNWSELAQIIVRVGQ